MFLYFDKIEFEVFDKMINQMQVILDLNVAIYNFGYVLHKKFDYYCFLDILLVFSISVHLNLAKKMKTVRHDVSLQALSTHREMTSLQP